jgi:hypothetical protein
MSKKRKTSGTARKEIDKRLTNEQPKSPYAPQKRALPIKIKKR